MLLKALYDVGHRLLQNAHVERRKVHVLIPITASGALAADGVSTLNSEDKRGKPTLGKELLVPAFPGSNNGERATFLCDYTTYVLGFETPSGEGLALPPKGKSKPAKRFLDFWEQLESARSATALPQLCAIIQFRDRFLGIQDDRAVHSLPFVEMREIGTKNKRLAICARTVGEDWIPLENATVFFQVDGNLAFSADPGDPLNQYWKDTYRRRAFAGDDTEQQDLVHRGLCLVTEATDAAIARSHNPQIQRIPGLTGRGRIVSFAKECPAFSSYGFEMAENAPVSEEAAAAYALGLQSLLDNENHSLKIGPSVVCFWARKDDRQAGFIASMLRKADPKAVSDFLKSPWAGVDRELAKEDQFYSVTLSGNAGRVVVRHWMQSTVAQARDSLRKWFGDLDIVQMGHAEASTAQRKKASRTASLSDEQDAALSALALYNLARTTVRDQKDLRSSLLNQLYLAAIQGRPIPSTAIQAVLCRLRADISKYGSEIVETPIPPRTLKALRDAKQPVPPPGKSRFALLRLILNRMRKEGDPMCQPQVFETEDEAYNCGRLLAVLADAQAKAHDYKLEGSGVAERYFGTASISPSSVFPLLLRLNRHHLDKIKKSEKYSTHAGYIEDDIQEILICFKPDGPGSAPCFPRYLQLQEQGRFAIGFYQEKAAADAQRKAARQDPQDQPQQPEEVSK